MVRVPPCAQLPSSHPTVLQLEHLMASCPAFPQEGQGLLEDHFMAYLGWVRRECGGYLKLRTANTSAASAEGKVTAFPISCIRALAAASPAIAARMLARMDSWSTPRGLRFGELSAGFGPPASVSPFTNLETGR